MTLRRHSCPANARSALRWAFLGSLVWSRSVSAFGAEGRHAWHVDFVLDQSGSMVGEGHNDPKANALIAPMILADTSRSEDTVTVVPQSGAGQAVAPFSLDTSSRDTFRQRVLSMRSQATGSDYQAALERAVADVESSEGDRERALILLYDGDKRTDSKTAPASGLRTRLDEHGIFSVVLAMNRNGESYLHSAPLVRAFESRFVRHGKDLLAAFGYAFRKLINAKDDPPSGTASATDIRVKVPALSREAWLFVVADGAVSSVDVASSPAGPPPAIDRPAHAVWTSTLPDLRRGYRGIRLHSPHGGEWTFKATAASPQVDWILLPIYGLDFTVGSPISAAKGGASMPVEVTLGEDAPSGLRVTARVGPDGPESQLACEGRSCTGTVTHAGEGPAELTVRATTDNMDVTDSIPIEVRRMDTSIDCSQFQDMIVASETAFTFTHRQSGPPPEEVWAELDGARISMAASGTDGWIGTGSAGAPGKKHIALHAKAGGQVNSCDAEIDVRPCLAPQIVLPPGPLEWGPCTAEPNADCEACGGGCTGIDVAFSVNGLEGAAARITLASDLPNGVSAWLGERRLTPTEWVDLNLSAPTGTLRLCSSECPSVGLGESLDLRVEVASGMYCSGSVATPVAKGNGSVGIRPRQAGFWECHRRQVYVAIAASVLAFLIYGFFIRPLRFKRKGTASIPSSKLSTQMAKLASLNSSAADLLKRRALGGFWWRHQEAWLDDELTPTRVRANALVFVRLVTSAPKGAHDVVVPRSGAAWIRSTRTLHRSKGSWRQGAEREAYRNQWEVVPPEGEPLKVDYLYRVEGRNGRFALVFTK